MKLRVAADDMTLGGDPLKGVTPFAHQVPDDEERRSNVQVGQRCHGMTRRRVGRAVVVGKCDAVSGPIAVIDDRAGTRYAVGRAAPFRFGR